MSKGVVTLLAPYTARKEVNTEDNQDQAWKDEKFARWQRLNVKLPDDQQTLWWLKGMGANVEVLKPSTWREEIRDDARRILAQSSLEATMDTET